MKYLGNAEIKLITFSDKIHQRRSFSIKGGEWQEIKSLLQQQVYDGGTAFHRFNEKDFMADEVLLFSDGLDNLGALTPIKKTRFYAVNSLVSSNHQFLNQVANAHGGHYLNLGRLTAEEAFNRLQIESYQFLGISGNNSIYDFYPNSPQTVEASFRLAGRFSAETQFSLLFGFGGKVEQEVPVRIESSNGSTIIRRIWALEKLKALSERKKQNKKAIIDLGIKYKLITDYTSMIVLDRLEDYVRYRIEPPKELLEDYKERIEDFKEEENELKEDLADRQEELLDGYSDLRDWFKNPIPKIKKTSNSSVNSAPQPASTTGLPSGTTASPARRTPPPTPASPPRRPSTVIDTTGNRAYGSITDSSGLPLPGASIVVVGTSRGTQSNFDGEFSIEIEEGETLRIAYIGFKTEQVLVEASNVRINLTLEEDASMLQEVVIAGYSSDGQQTTPLTQSSKTILSTLNGSVSGVEIQHQSGQSGAGRNLRLRGNNSINTASTPLIVIDGVPGTQNELNQLSPDAIHSLSVLQEAAATALYGSRGAQGVIIITTKTGLENDREQIEEFNEVLDKKIELQEWQSDADYIKILKKEKSVEDAYAKYLEIRSGYLNQPSFFLDVSKYFALLSQDKAITILTNLIEIELENYELLRALAYTLESFEEYDLATYVYQKVLELRPEDPQSYRDLALAYEAVGQYKKSFDLMHYIYEFNLLEKDPDELYYGIEEVVFMEMSRLAHKYKKKLKLPRQLRKNLIPLELDFMVVVDWNHKDTDLDLWVTEPSGELVNYQNTESKHGGHLSWDMTEGFGPEQYMIKRPQKGNTRLR